MEVWYCINDFIMLKCQGLFFVLRLTAFKTLKIQARETKKYDFVTFFFPFSNFHGNLEIEFTINLNVSE